LLNTIKQALVDVRPTARTIQEGAEEVAMLLTEFEQRQD